MTRAHRLWESYLVNEVGLEEGQIHEDAERLEHHLSEDILDEVDEKLGFPDKDPHGSPIPKRTLPKRSLLQLDKNQDGHIAIYQINDYISTTLWKLGVLPEEQIQIINKNEESIKVRQGDKTIEIPSNLAAIIAVYE